MKEKSRQLTAKARTAYTEGGQVEYAREGFGPSTLVIHGAGGGFDQGLLLGHDLLGDKYDIIAPSRFGYLGTPLPENGSTEAQANAHVALLDALDVDRVIVVGVSAGAPSAIELAAHHPERVSALILVVPRAYDPDHQVGPDNSVQSNALFKMINSSADFAYWLTTRVARKPMVRFVGVNPALVAQAPKQERQKVVEIMDAMLPISARTSGMRNDGAIAITEPDFDHIKVPTLIISAEDDLMNTASASRYAVDHIAKAELRLFESGGHLLVNRSEEVRGASAEFLQRRLGSKLAPDSKGDSKGGIKVEVKQTIPA
jgi:pimeloyl-ACP methyl ester carboxylesterase